MSSGGGSTSLWWCLSKPDTQAARFLPYWIPSTPILRYSNPREYWEALLSWRNARNEGRMMRQESSPKICSSYDANIFSTTDTRFESLSHVSVSRSIYFFYFFCSSKDHPATKKMLLLLLFFCTELGENTAPRKNAFIQVSLNWL